MRSSNEQLKLKLKQVLNDIGYPVYSNYVPHNETSPAYLLISTLASTDASTMQSHDTDISFQIGIYTKENIANPGEICDLIAEGVYQRILPDTDSILDLTPDFQCTGITFISDNDNVTQLNSFVAINRFITFRLNLYHGN